MEDLDGVVADQMGRLAHALLETVEVARPFLREWPSATALRPQHLRRLPVLAHLDEVRSFATPATAPFVDALVRHATVLEWNQTYPAADVGADFLASYGWTEFVGLRGPLASESIACGVLMLGPGADYPLHEHEAEELYLPVAGTALWRRGDGGFVVQAPGTPIYHPPFMPHAMRTGAEPLLALYLWRGNGIATKARLLPNASSGAVVERPTSRARWP